jgi:hypothetical protein
MVPRPTTAMTDRGVAEGEAEAAEEGEAAEDGDAAVGDGRFIA